VRVGLCVDNSYFRDCPIIQNLVVFRYALRSVDLKDMVVIDLWNAGEQRPVETLSGGESFLVSLALALSELSSGWSRLESLFLDEGFGTLDSETLDAALNALESLRLSGRTIGVISHIDQLTRRIPVRIDVKSTGGRDCTIAVEIYILWNGVLKN